MATRVIDDSKLQDIAVAIQSKDNGGQMTVDEMPGRIETLNTTDRWELLNEVTLDEDVSIIKIDISSYVNEYSAFMVAPSLTPSSYTEWFYAGIETFSGIFNKGSYNNKFLEKGDFDFPNYLAYCSLNLRIIVANNFAGNINQFLSENITNTKYIVLSLYNSESTFLKGGSYKLYGKKKEDYFDAN